MLAKTREDSTDAAPQIVIVVNGPGEIVGWLWPLGTTIKQIYPDVRICVALLPCVFSSGAELGVVKNLPFVDAVCSVADSLALVMRGRLPDGFRRNGPGLLLHLGGETGLSFLMGKRLGLDCVAYVEDPFPLQNRFAKVYYTGFKAIPETKRARGSQVIGEMMVDASWMRCPGRDTMDRSRKIVALYPGSRDYIVKYSLPFMGAVADCVAKLAPHVEWVVARAEFLPLTYLRDFPDVHDGRPFEGDNLGFEEGPNGPALVTSAGTRLRIVSPNDVPAHATMAITIPGTTTAELGTLGVPLILILPTVWAETSPLPGPAGWIGRLPIIGRYIKRGLALLFLRKLKLISHPNRRAGRMVVPEIVGRFQAANVASKILDMLDTDLLPLEEELRTIMGERGATQRLVNALRPWLRRGPAQFQDESEHV